MENKKLIISPKTKVGELLECYPHLEKVLMEMSPAFEKLKNPILRKTVARVATLAQVAVVGGLKVEDIVKRLRSEAGQDEDPLPDAGHDYITTIKPAWFSEKAVREVFDATPVINAGESPMGVILSKARSLGADEILELHTPFVPAPIIDQLHEKGFITFTTSECGIFSTRIKKDSTRN